MSTLHTYFNLCPVWSSADPWHAYKHLYTDRSVVRGRGHQCVRWLLFKQAFIEWQTNKTTVITAQMKHEVSNKLLFEVDSWQPWTIQGGHSR